MEEGEFRCDVNISLKPVGSETLGVRGEIKNLNSFKFVGQAIDYEIVRQSGLYERGERVLQETLHFDSEKGETRSLRSKEEAHDYRYFPQPDLPPVEVHPDLISQLKNTLPEPPEVAKERLISEGLKKAQADLLLERPGALDYFDKVLVKYHEAGKIFPLMEELFLPFCQKENISPLESKFTPELMAKLARLVAEGTLGRRKTQELFPDFFINGTDPEKALSEGNLTQITDSNLLLPIIKEVVQKNEKQVLKYIGGEEKILSFLVGMVMKNSQGRADPKKASELMKEYIKSL
jgi:aspartyl-tRNA(Asn)/glutamyl-tRNA(Gln) amidotransferase subunit B